MEIKESRDSYTRPESYKRQRRTVYNDKGVNPTTDVTFINIYASKTDKAILADLKGKQQHKEQWI